MLLDFFFYICSLFVLTCENRLQYEIEMSGHSWKGGLFLKGYFLVNIKFLSACLVSSQEAAGNVIVLIQKPKTETVGEKKRFNVYVGGSSMFLYFTKMKCRNFNDRRAK